MKKIVFIGIVSTTLYMVSHAQKDLSIGLELKPQITTAWGENHFFNSEDEQRKPDYKFAYGLCINYSVSERITIGTGTYFNPQGFSEGKIKIQNIQLNTDFWTNIHYLRFPLSLKYLLKNTEKYQIRIGAESGYNYLIDVNDNLRNVIGFINTVIEEPDVRYNTNLFDLGISLELDYKLLSDLYLTTRLEGTTFLTRFHKPYEFSENISVDINSKLLCYGITVGLNYYLH